MVDISVLLIGLLLLMNVIISHPPAMSDHRYWDNWTFMVEVIYAIEAFVGIVLIIMWGLTFILFNNWFA